MAPRAQRRPAVGASSRTRVRPSHEGRRARFTSSTNTGRKSRTPPHSSAAVIDTSSRACASSTEASADHLGVRPRRRTVSGVPGYGQCAGGGEERQEEYQRDDVQAEGSERKDVDRVKAIGGYARPDVCRAGKGGARVTLLRGTMPVGMARGSLL